MSDAYDTLINDLGRPYLGVRHIVGTTFFGNEGSVKVFLKNNFILTRQLPDHVEVKGKLQSFNVLESHFVE
jgi:RimJ/RimL family protein N-acetyltransferase